MKVSIAMATYNGSRYIEEQLDSFLAQTRLPDELIITDDCSTDNTVKIIKDFAKNVPFPVTLSINEKNLGYAGNFNAALEKTTGDLVFLSDQDDVWFPDKIEYIAKLAEENLDILVFMNDAALTDGSLNETGLTKIGQIKSAGMSMNSFVMGCCCIVRRELLDICMPIPADYKAHDNWIVEFANGLNVKKVDNKVLQYYRRHESNQSQFIANRTTKVTKKQVLLKSIKGLFDIDARSRDEKSIKQMRILALGIERVHNSYEYRKDMNKLLIDKNKEIKIQTERLKLRNKNFIVRTPLVLFHSIKGDYADTSGMRAVIRDMIGYPSYWFKLRK